MFIFINSFERRVKNFNLLMLVLKSTYLSIALYRGFFLQELLYRFWYIIILNTWIFQSKIEISRSWRCLRSLLYILILLVQILWWFWNYLFSVSGLQWYVTFVEEWFQRRTNWLTWYLIDLLCIYLFKIIQEFTQMCVFLIIDFIPANWLWSMIKCKSFHLSLYFGVRYF